MTLSLIQVCNTSVIVRTIAANNEFSSQSILVKFKSLLVERPSQVLLNYLIKIKLVIILCYLTYLLWFVPKEKNTGIDSSVFKEQSSEEKIYITNNNTIWKITELQVS